MRNMMKRATAVVLLGSQLLLASCVRMPAGVTSSTLPITAYDEYVVTGEVMGKDSALGLLNFAIWSYSAHDAIKNAREVSGVDGMINVTAENKVVWLTLIFPLITWHTIQVKGEGIQFTKGGPNS